MQLFTILLVPMITCALPPARLPAAVDLRPEFVSFGLTPGYQGSRNTCSLFAITAMAEFELARHSPKEAKALSREYLVWASNEVAGDHDDQAMFYHATQGLQSLGICADELMPYQKSTDINRKPSAEALSDAKGRTHWSVQWIKRWEVNTGLSETQLQAVKQQLAQSHPVAVGLRWPKQEQRGRDHVIKMPPAGDVFDGHSILFVGYRDDDAQPGGGVFLFRNSNGPRWAMEGYAYLSYAYVRAYANDAVAIHLIEPRTKTLVLECESMQVLKNLHCQVSQQKMTQWGTHLWSNDKQLFCRCEKDSSFTLELNVPEQGNYHLELFATCAPDFGKLRLSLDGKPIGSLVDLYGGRIYPSGAINLGTHQLTAGKHHLHVAIAGKNEHSKAFHVGLDALQLHPVR